jgi:hypothetical protein
MPNQPNPNRTKLSVDIPMNQKLKLARYGVTLGYILSDYGREALFRAATDIRDGTKIVLTPSFVGDSGKIIVVCDKDDKLTVTKFAKESRTTISAIVRNYIADLCNEIDQYGVHYMHRPLDNE